MCDQKSVDVVAEYSEQFGALGFHVRVMFTGLDQSDADFQRKAQESLNDAVAALRKASGWEESLNEEAVVTP